VNRDLFLTALEVLAAAGQDSDVRPEHVSFLRRHAPTEEADLPIDDLCCRIIRRQIRTSPRRQPTLPAEGEILRQETSATLARPTLHDVERAYIERVLRDSGGNVTQAARVLGIDRTTLHCKLKRYGVHNRWRGTRPC
jgi:transcriptional regulator of acetoin/glycerol metabolism